MTNGLKPLMVFDFDGTLVDSKSDSPNGMSVPLAYDLAIQQVFGKEGHRVYREFLGGLNNREPGQLVAGLVHTARRLDVSIREYPSLRDATEELVQLRLLYMMSEISKDWPKMHDGVVDLFTAVGKEEIPVETAIVSSGHDAFISRTFKVNGLIPPRILITSDIIRNRTQPTRPLYKPSTYQLARAHQQWLKDHNGHLTNEFTGRAQEKQRMIYFGDDPKNDGELALNARIPFGFVPFMNPCYKPDPDLGQFLVDDFKNLTDLLTDYADELREGRSFSEIFLRKPDSELFPAVKEEERPWHQYLERNTKNPSLKEHF